MIYRIVYKRNNEKTENVNLKFINIGFLSISAHLLPYIDSTLIITQMDFMDFKITRISNRNDS